MPYQPYCPDPYQIKVQDRNHPTVLFDLYHFVDVESNCLNSVCHQFDHLRV